MESNKCKYSDNVSKATCKICYKKFKMCTELDKGPCCLDLCGEYEKCRGCKRGIYSEEYKEWRKIYGK